MKVLLTGSASHLSRATLPALCKNTNIDSIVGIDLKPSGFSHPKYAEHLVDIRSSRIRNYMIGCDAVIHMAFIVQRGDLKKQRNDRRLIHDINVNGSINIFNAARRENIRTLVYLSSAVVYGISSFKTGPIEEDQILESIPGFIYSEDKVEVEHWLDAFETKSGLPYIIRLRPQAIIGLHAQPLLLNLLRQPCYLALPKPQPKLQCVAESDVANAIENSIFSNKSACYNLAAPDCLTFKDMIQTIHKTTFALPISVVRPLHKLIWIFSGKFGEPGWLHALQHGLTINCGRAKDELFWSPRLDIKQCLRQISGK